MDGILIKSHGDYFQHGGVEDNRFAGRQIPKNNYRSITLENAEISDSRELELSVSSDKPYLRWFGYEELEHTEAAVDLSRFNDSANVLFNHDRDAYIGVVVRAWLDGGKLKNIIRFDTHELAERIYNSVKNGIIRNVSIGYGIDELMEVKDAAEPTYRVTKWTPFETSLVTVPADATVGVGRSYFDFGENSDKKSKVLKDTPSAIKSQKSKVLNEENPTMTVETPPIDQAELLKAERERSEQLLAAGKKYNCPDLAQQGIKEGWSITELRSQIVDYKAPQKPVADISPVGMSNKERKKYSVLKAIGYAAKHLSKDEAGLELEVSREIQKRTGTAPKGIYIDQAELVSYRAPYETGVPAAAGNLIETELLSERFIEQLYNQSAFLPMGVTYLRDLTGNVEIPRESTFTGGYWVGEKQTIPEDEGTFDKITMSPKKLAVITKFTFEMIEQGSIDLEMLARNRMLRGLALEIDRTIGFGSGIGEQPLGIASHPETKSVVLGANGGPLDWAALIAMQTELFANNVMGNFGYVVNARTKGKLQTTLDQNTGGGNWIWNTTAQGNGTIAGYPARCSNQIPNNLVKGTATNLTAAFFGDFSNVLLGMWSGMDVLANPYSQFSEAIIQVRAMQLCDVQLTRGDYFVLASDFQNN